MTGVEQLAGQIEQDIQNMIKKYDKNGDQKLTFKEIFAVLREQNDPNPGRTALQMLRTYDTDGDNCISIDEVKANMHKVNKEAIVKAIRKEVKEIYDSCDNNRDGKITFDEMHKALSKNLDPELARHQAQFFFDEVDTDGNGVLTIEEIRKYVGGDLYNPQQ